MVKKKKNPNNNNDDNKVNDLDVVDLEEVSDLVKTSLSVSKDDLKKLKVESAKKGLSMGGYIRDLVSSRFKADNRVKKDVSSNLKKILDQSSGIFDDFKVGTFINGMYDAGIDLADLSNGEWVAVRSKIRSGSKDFADAMGLFDVDISGEDVVAKFDLISPSRKQKLDLLKIFRE